MMLSGSWNAITLLEAILPAKGAELDLLIVMKRTHSVQTTYYPSTVTVNVTVDDAPRIIEQFTNLFTTQQCNIAELTSKTQPATETQPAQLEIQITAHDPLNDNGIIIKNKFQQLCTMLNAKGNISIVNNPKMQS